MRRRPPSRILIYRLGSIGDCIVALPCLHLVRRLHPDATIALLTNEPVEGRAAPAASVLEGAGLVDRYIAYPVGTRDLRELQAIRREVAAFSPDLFVYLPEYRGLRGTVRDYLFFLTCAGRRSVGYPFASDLRRLDRRSPDSDLWQSEACRLGRRVAALGDAGVDRPENWDLGLSARERDDAARLVAAGTDGVHRLVALSIGTKQANKEWGDDNWQAVLDRIARRDIGLMLIGAAHDAARSAALASRWPGPVLNFCGALSPRGSAAVLRHADLLLCHDSGPMHLAATVCTVCVAVFGTHNRPGTWFPFGTGHRVLYPTAEGQTIRSITPDQVVAEVTVVLGALPRSARRVTG
jgi:heptosyltransferase III